MIEYMRNVNIVGRIDDIDRVVEKYIAKYDIQLEYAFKELADADILSFSVLNPYADAFNKVESFKKQLGAISALRKKDTPYPELTGEQSIKVVEKARQVYDRHDHALKELEEKSESLKAMIDIWEPFRELAFEIKLLDNFERIAYRFGRMSTSNFKQFEAFLDDHPEILLVQGKSDKEYIWGVYFVPAAFCDKADSIFSSLHFERLAVSNVYDGKKYSGTPEQFLDTLQEQLTMVQAEINKRTRGIMQASDIDNDEFLASCEKIQELYVTYDIKKYAARTKRDFFVFVGWMPEGDAALLEKEIELDDLVIFVKESEEKAVTVGTDMPPTKLRNLPIIRHFEFFVKMYGMPQYNELDPTPFVAITYTILFGLMFGDLGQGALIALLGLFLYKKKKLALGAIMGVIGVSSMFFGILYGSVFGFEEVIPAVWTKPGENINSTLIMAVVLGVFLIVSTMAINIISAYRRKDWGKFFFGPNGIAGLVFYGSVVGIALSVVYRQMAVATVIVVIFIVIPLILIALRKPLTKILQGKKEIVEDRLALFVFETVIELFEVLLTYFTNTLSFVRVGAFALSHAGMMSVVMLLSKTADGSHNLIVIVLGNILVMALEGLVVGIQVLRLEFYEMFSRFFEGGGREFQSHKEK